MLLSVDILVVKKLKKKIVNQSNKVIIILTMKVIFDKVPTHIQNSISYDDFTDFGDEATSVDISKDKCYFSLDINDLSQLRLLLSTFQYWGVRVVPVEIYDFFFDCEEKFEKSDVISVLKDFYQYNKCSDFEYILNWRYEAEQKWFKNTWNDQIKKETRSYLTCRLARKGNLNCLISAMNKGYHWDSRLFTNAAKYGHLHILQYFAANHTIYTKTFNENNEYITLSEDIPWCSYAVQKAASNGHLKCMQFMIDNGCEIPEYCEDASNHIDCLKYLHKLGSNITEGLNYSFGTCNIECYDYLVQNGWTPNAIVFINCATSGNRDCFEHALKNNCPSNFIWDGAVFSDLEMFKYTCEKLMPTQSDMQNFFFHYTVYNENFEFFEYIIETYSIEIDERTLYYVLQGCNIDSVMYTLDKYQGPRDVKKMNDQMFKNNYVEVIKYGFEHMSFEWTNEALATMIANGNYECIKYAFKSGFTFSDDVLIKEIKENRSSYDFQGKSVTKEKMNVIMYCIEHGQQLDSILLSYAICNDNFELIEYLCKAGCDISNACVDTINYSSYSKIDYIKYMEYFLSKGCKLTPQLFDRSVEHNKREEIIDYLIEKECQKSNKTITIVLTSLYGFRGREKIIDYLFEKGFVAEDDIYERLIVRYRGESRCLNWIKYFYDKGYKLTYGMYSYLFVTINHKVSDDVKEFVDFIIGHGVPIVGTPSLIDNVFVNNNMWYLPNKLYLIIYLVEKGYILRHEHLEIVIDKFRIYKSNEMFKFVVDRVDVTHKTIDLTLNSLSNFDEFIPSLYERVGVKMTHEEVMIAANKGYAATLEYGLEHGIKWTKEFANLLAKNRSSSCLSNCHTRYHDQVVAEGNVFWDEDFYMIAIRYNAVGSVRIAHENGCPFDDRIFETTFRNNAVSYVQRHMLAIDPNACDGIMSVFDAAW